MKQRLKNLLPLLRRLLANRVAQNAGWLIGGQIAQMLVSLIVGLLTIRYLGPSNYGLIDYGMAYTNFFYCFCTLGINSVIVKELIANADREGEIMGTALGLRGISSFLSALVIISISSFLDRGDPLAILIVALCSIGVLFQVLELFRYWFQSKLQSKVPAIISLIAYIITAAYRIFLLATGKSVSFFALAYSVDYCLAGVLLFLMYKKYGGQRISFSLPYAKELLKISSPFIIPSLMVAIYSQTDRLMLKQMISPAEIGYYSSALSLCTLWCFVLSAIIDSMYPTIMEAFSRSREEFTYKNKLLYAIVIYLSVFVSIFLVLLAKPVILLLYGPEYLPAVGPLRIITWYTAFSYLGVARNAWIVCNNKQRYLKYVYFSGAAANIVFNLILIPRWGASGAALASFAAQITTTIIAPFFIPDLHENSVMMLESFLLKGQRRSSL